ncbi:hypothetical protein ACYPKM_03300 [Pseudomonas aeruginosa]
MNVKSDLQVILGGGLVSPYTVTGSLISYISEGVCEVSQVFPGLADLVGEGEQQTCALFVERLIDVDTLEGVILEREFDEPRVPDEREWLIQIEAGPVGWQYTLKGPERPQPRDMVMLLRWKQDGTALTSCLALHDKLVAESEHHAAHWLIGSEIEKEAFSRYLLVTGLTTLFSPFEDLGYFDQADSAPGDEVAVNVGGCEAIRAYRIRWQHL